MTYVCTERIFDSRLFLCNKIFSDKIIWVFEVCLKIEKSLLSKENVDFGILPNVSIYGLQSSASIYVCYTPDGLFWLNLLKHHKNTHHSIAKLEFLKNMQSWQERFSRTTKSPAFFSFSFFTLCIVQTNANSLSTKSSVYPWTSC